MYAKQKTCQVIDTGTHNKDTRNIGSNEQTAPDAIWGALGDSVGGKPRPDTDRLGRAYNRAGGNDAMR